MSSYESYKQVFEEDQKVIAAQARRIGELEEELREAKKQAKEFFALLTPQQVEDWRHR